jgi:hypothetical protein
MTIWQRLSDILPAPMAAPETPALRSMRLSLIAALALLGTITLFWRELLAVIGSWALALVAVLIIFMAGLGPLWLAAKCKADAAWLELVASDESECFGSDDEARELARKPAQVEAGR